MPWAGPQFEGDFPTLGHLAGQWIERNVVVPDGYLRGQPYKLTDEMWRFLLHYYRLYTHAAPWPAPDSLRYTGGQLRRSQKWGKDPFGAAIILAEALGPTRFDGWATDDRDDPRNYRWDGERIAPGEPIASPYPTPLIVCLGTSEDQPLALDTPVPTPSGWSTVGALRFGDTVFDGAGKPTQVVRETPVFLGEDCYAVVFSDGERIVASGSHLWSVEDGTKTGSGRRVDTVTTAQLAARCRTNSGRKRYRLPIPPAWDLPDMALPVAPYVLGLWLGDGSSTDATIAYDTRHRGEVEASLGPLLREYETIVWRAGPGNVGTLRIRRRSGLCAWGHEFAHDKVFQTCGQCRRRRSVRAVPEKLWTLRERLRALGVFGNKHIPAEYLRASSAQRRAVLQGLIDSDGHIEPNGRACFTNTNRQLIDGVTELLTTLGYRWHLRRDEASKAWRLFFVPGVEPVARLAYKMAAQRSPTARSYSQWRYVESVDRVESVPVRCIGIDTPDHLFLVGRQGVQTHNTSNTWRPLLGMIRLGPLAELEGIDAGETRVNLPGGGTIEPVTTSARARLGAPLTFLTITESHLFALQGGYRRVCGAVKRNVAGMDGRWLELTNAWDPTEGSEAQVTAEAEDERVLIDTIEPRRVEDLTDDEALYAELLRQYGDSSRERGGWVNLRGRIMDEARSKRHMEADRRRFFLNEIVVGESAFVDPVRWDFYTPGDPYLAAGEKIALGFDGSKYQDATALIACRITDGRLFQIRVWERPLNAPVDWRVPSTEVDSLVKATFEAYRVGYLFADPFRWQDYLDAWSALWPDKVVEFATNQEQRMDKAIERFTTAFVDGAITHDGSELLTTHAKNAVLVKGQRKKPRPGEEDKIATHYMKMAKRGDGMWIDAAVAAVLAYAARGQAIEDKVFNDEMTIEGDLFASGHETGADDG